MVNLEQMVNNEGRALFQSLDREPGLDVDGAFWTGITLSSLERPRLKILVRQLAKVGPTKLYATIQRLMKHLRIATFTFEDVSLVDDDDRDVVALREVSGPSGLHSMLMPNLPNSAGATAYVYRMAPKQKRKA